MGKLIKGPWSLLTDSQVDLQIPSNKLEYVSFDVETTGLNRSDRIVEIGFVAFSEGKVLEEWSTLLNPLRDIGKSNIHGITPTALPLLGISKYP